MFKPGDKALVVETGQIVTVEEVVREASLYRVIKTSGGPFHESSLHQAHQTVLDTIAAKEPDYFKDLDEKPKSMIERVQEVSWELVEKAAELMGKAKLEVDFRGHWKNGAVLTNKEIFTEHLLDTCQFLLMDNADLKDLVEVLEFNKRKRKKHTKKKLDRWIGIERSRVSSTACTFCGLSSYDLETDGIHLRVRGESCPLPNGFEPNVWELNVPSGKLVVENSLGNWFPLPEGDHDCDINTTKGCRIYTQLHADIGLSFGFVGNTCPGVYKLKDGSYKIANEPWDSVWDEKAKKYVDRAEGEMPDFEGEEVAGICTDLWWYSICDYEELERRYQHFGDYGRKSMDDFTVIDVEPGVYRFRHYDCVDCDHGDEVIYADFVRVREPDPVQDFLAKYTELPEVTPHAYVQRKAKQWPTLYGKVKNAYRANEKVIPWEDMTEEERLSSWQRVADQTFFTIGSGNEWHENGWPVEKVDFGIPDVDPPEFRYQASWYPFSKKYGGIFGGNKLSPSFAKFAMRCLESVISFGMKVHDGARCRETEAVRERMLLAVEKYREMERLYPEAADPDYVWWLSQEGRAEEWVENFDLGPKKTEKHKVIASLQRWIPEDAYAVEFDARKLKAGPGTHFAGELGWSKKKDATGYAIEERTPSQDLHEDSNCWLAHAKETVVPLYSVAKVVNLGEVSHMGNVIAEISYEYGTNWMQDSEIRKGLEEKTLKDAIRVLTRKEYEELLPKAKQFYEDSKS